MIKVVAKAKPYESLGYKILFFGFVHTGPTMPLTQAVALTAAIRLYLDFD